MALLVQEFLKTKSLLDLEKEHGVEASIDDYKFSLNYNQIVSHPKDKLAQECRGLILSTLGGSKVNPEEPLGVSKVLAFPMKRFFNYGDDSAVKIDWNSAKIFEKLDGTCCIVYFDFFKEKWCVATRSVPEANLPLGFKNYTFRTLFEKAVQDTFQVCFEKFTNKLSLGTTYCFELTTPLNRIVVDYQNYTVNLIAARDCSHEEKCITRWEYAGLNPVKEYNFSSMKEILEYVHVQNPMQHEGVVIRDDQFNRLKIKNLSYVAAHRAKDSVTSSIRNCVTLVLEEKADDVVTMLHDDIAKEVLSLQDKIRDFIKGADELYKELSDGCEDSKDFADKVSRKAAISKVWTAPLFAMWRGKASSTLEFIKNTKRNNKYPKKTLDSILELVGEK